MSSPPSPQQTPPSTDMAAFRESLSKSKHIIAVAGAGLSAASGIPTFRGAGGMWRKYDAMGLATPEAFAASPSLVWQFYHYRRETALRCEPNRAHEVLAKLSVPAYRNEIAPDSTFTLITQNVDGLSRRALDSLYSSTETADAGSTNASNANQPAMLEMHGKLFDVACTSPSCKHRELDFTSPVTPALAGTELLFQAGESDPNIPVAALPHCKKCGALARPGVVWFGETPHHLRRIDKLVAKADLCLVVGTSSTVYPAAGYASMVQDGGGKVAVFNLDRSAGDDDADFLFLGPCEETLPEALGFGSQ